MIAGAVNEIAQSDGAADDAITKLLEDVDEEINDGWPEHSTFANRADALVADMQERIGDASCPTIIREMLAAHGLLP